MSHEQQLEYEAIRAAYRQLEEDLVYVMGAGFEHTARYREISAGVGDPLDDSEQDLVTRAADLKRRVEAMEAAADAAEAAAAEAAITLW